MLMVLNLFVVQNLIDSRTIKPLYCVPTSYCPSCHIFFWIIVQQSSRRVWSVRKLMCPYTLLIQSNCELITAERLAFWKLILLQNWLQIQLKYIWHFWKASWCPRHLCMCLQSWQYELCGWIFTYILQNVLNGKWKSRAFSAGGEGGPATEK